MAGRFLLGQQNNRLHVPRAREHIHGTGPGGLIAQLPENLHISAQGSWVAGDIHHLLGSHGRHGGDDLGGQSLSGRVHGDDVGPQALRLQLRRDVRRVAAEELRVLNAVPGGVFLGVLDGRRHDLRADSPPGLLGKAEGDGSRAAVQVQHRLLSGQSGKFQGLAIQRLRLVPVHLIEGRNRQLEPEAAEGVHQKVLAPDGAVFIPQYDIALFRVGVQHHAHRSGRRRLDERRQLRLPGELFAVGNDAAQALALFIHPDVNMADETLAGALVVRRNLIFFHPVSHGLGRLVGDLRLDEAAIDGDNPVRPGLEKADGAVSSHGVLALIAVVRRVLGPYDLLYLEVGAAQAGQGVLHPLTLGPQLLRIAHMLEVAAAALAEIGALRLRPLRGGFFDFHDLSRGAGLHHFCDAQVDVLAPDGLGHEHHSAVQAHDAEALAGVALHGASVDVVFKQFFHNDLGGTDFCAGIFLRLPLLQQLTELVGKTGEALVVPPLGALDGRHEHLAHSHQPLVGSAGLSAADGLGLPLGQIAGRQHLVGNQIVDFGVLGCVGGEAHALDGLGKEGRHLPVAVDHKDVLGLGLLEVGDPAQQVVPVGVGGKALEIHDLGVDGDLLAEHLDALGALQQGAAQSALALIAHEHHGALSAPQIMLQVVADTARVAHAGGGDDDLGGGFLVQGLGLLAGLRHPQIRKVEHMGAVLYQLQGVLIQVAAEVPGEDGGGLFRKRRVDIDGEIRIGLHQSRVLDLPDEVQKLLSAAHGERGDDDVAAPGDGLVNDGGQVVGIAPYLGVVAVTVGGFHDHIVRAVDMDRIPDDGLVDVAQVAGEHQSLRHAALRRVHDDAGRAQQMAGVHEFQRHALAQGYLFTVFAGGHELPDPGGVLDGVKRLHTGRAGALALAVLPLGVLLLDMGGVQQHDVQQVRRQAGGDDAALESLLDEHRDAAGVVDMGVGHQHIVDAVCRKGELGVGGLVPALLQSAVHQNALTVHFQAVTAAGHALIGAEKAELHKSSSFGFCGDMLFSI